MSQIMKSFFALFMVLTFLVVCSGILGAFMNVMCAQNLHAQLVGNIEDSDFDEKVIEACKTNAKNMGYELSLTPYYEGDEIAMMKVELEFCISVGVFSMEDSHVISGYAR